MAWRRSSEAGLNLDSLLDTMTNGVGILIVVLCLTQVEFSRLVGGAKTSTGRVPSVEEVKVATDRLRELEDALKQIQDQWRLKAREQSRNLVDIRHLEALIAKLKKLLEDQPPSVDAEAVRNEIKRSEAEREKVKEQIAKLEKELRDLREQLAALRKPVTPPPGSSVELRVPQVRELAANTVPVFYFCRKGQLFLVEHQEIDRKINAGVRAAVNKPAGPLNLQPGDLDRIAAHFERNDVGSRDHRVKMANFLGATLKMTLLLREGAKGETPEEFARPASRYRTKLQEVKRSSTPAVVKFIVWGESDSFKAYIQARATLDEQKITGGWVPFDASEEYEEVLGGGGPGRLTGDN